MFSSTGQGKAGEGENQKKIDQHVVVFASEEDDGKITIRSLNEKFVPSGTAKVISRENLLKNFLPEPDIYMNKVLPAMRELFKTVARGERHLQNNETYSAEMEFKSALRIDEENIRATFGLGLSYLQRNDTQRGEIVFKRLVKLKGAFEPEHKHMFNEFGINLRKNKMFTQALKYYARAAQHSRQDENLFFNMARTYHDAGNKKLAMKMVRKALDINPEFEQAQKLRKHLQSKIPYKPMKA
ncbi:MAG: tetratricopeptide repeat protein [Desulfonatronovibrio sp.]